MPYVDYENPIGDVLSELQDEIKGLISQEFDQIESREVRDYILSMFDSNGPEEVAMVEDYADLLVLYWFARVNGETSDYDT